MAYDPGENHEETIKDMQRWTDALRDGDMLKADLFLKSAQVRATLAVADAVNKLEKTGRTIGFS